MTACLLKGSAWGPAPCDCRDWRAAAQSGEWAPRSTPAAPGTTGAPRPGSSSVCRDWLLGLRANLWFSKHLINNTFLFLEC